MTIPRHGRPAYISALVQQAAVSSLHHTCTSTTIHISPVHPQQVQAAEAIPSPSRTRSTFLVLHLRKYEKNEAHDLHDGNMASIRQVH